MITIDSPNWMRPLASTGISVSAVCVGGGPLGKPAGPDGTGVKTEDAVALVRQIFDSPLRWIDTSNGYSAGESERRIGAAIAANGGLPDDFVIATKVDPLDGDYSGARVRTSVAESKERLGLDFLPLVYLHDPEYYDFDQMTAPGGAVQTLMALRDEGEIGHVGLGAGNVHAMARYLDLGGFEIVLTHNRWSLVDRSAGKLIEQATSMGIAVLNAAVYGGGILANPAGATKYGYRPASEETLRAVAAMDQACREYGTDLATAAVQHSVNDPRITSTVIGFSKPDRIAGIVEGLAQPIPDALWDRLAELLPAEHNWLDHRPQS